MKLTKLNFLNKKQLTRLTYLKKNNNKIDAHESVLRLKKILHVIHKYNSLDKNILLVGTSFVHQIVIEKKFKKTNLISIPEYAWMNGIITNKRSCFQHIFKDKKSLHNTSRFLLQIKKKFDLILVYSKSSTNLSMLGELKSTRVPVIFFNTPNYRVTQCCYSADSDFNMLQLLLKAILKKKI